MLDDYYGKVHFMRCEDGAVSEIGTLYRRETVEGLGNLQVPIILDDSGEEVYGYECWWTPFDQRIVDEIERSKGNN